MTGKASTRSRKPKLQGKIFDALRLHTSGGDAVRLFSSTRQSHKVHFHDAIPIVGRTTSAAILRACHLEQVNVGLRSRSRNETRRDAKRLSDRRSRLPRSFLR